MARRRLRVGARPPRAAPARARERARHPPPASCLRTCAPTARPRPRPAKTRSTHGNRFLAARQHWPLPPDSLPLAAYYWQRPTGRALLAAGSGPPGTTGRRLAACHWPHTAGRFRADCRLRAAGHWPFTTGRHQEVDTAGGLRLPRYCAFLSNRCDSRIVAIRFDPAHSGAFFDDVFGWGSYRTWLAVHHPGSNPAAFAPVHISVIGPLQLCFRFRTRIRAAAH